MGLMEKIKQAEHVAHKGWDDLEGRMRQHWRIYPDRKAATAPPASHAISNEDATLTEVFDREQGRPINPGDILEMMARADLAPTTKPTSDISQQSPASNVQRKPIVSIHGKDVDENELNESQRKNNDAA